MRTITEHKLEGLNDALEITVLDEPGQGGACHEYAIDLGPRSLTTDRNDPELGKPGPDGQNIKYLVLSEEERAKGFVRPVRRKYKHLGCGTVTTMGLALAETYARKNDFYSGTFCCGCGTHFDLVDSNGKRAFVWDEDGTGVGE